MVTNTDISTDIESALGGDSLLVVSNRQPYKHSYDDDGTITVDRPAGGLTAGIDPVMQKTDGTWVAWGDGDADEEVVDEDDCVRVPPESEAYTLKRVWLTEEEVEDYYYGYSNQVLWPVCHGGMWKTKFANEFWTTYRDVNETFADAVVEQYDDDSLVWFQDYHFGLAPRMVREELPEAFLMHFWHIPWPSWDSVRSLPNHEEVLDGLLGNDLLGFHTDSYCENFLNCVDEAFETAFVDRDGKKVRYDGHTTYVESFPLSVDFDDIASKSAEADDEWWGEFRDSYGIGDGVQVAVGIDRLDYTKGIPERLDALARLWEEHPEWRGELTFFQKGSPSRSRISDYKELQEEVEEAVARINRRFGTDDWQPVIYTEEMLSETDLYGLCRHSDVALVSPLRDGMNLVAKEYVAAQHDEDGVLILSNQAGAHEEFGDDAVTINPRDIDEFVEQLQYALTMEDDERGERMRRLRDTVEEYDLFAWLEDSLTTARDVKRQRAAEASENSETR